MAKSVINKQIVEKTLGIPADYQFKAINSKFPFQANWHNNKLTCIENYIKPGMRILDLGTGSGNFELRYSKVAKEIVGVDYNTEALEFVKYNLKKNKIHNVKLILSDIRNLNNSRIINKFDLIIAIDVLEHVNYTDAKKVVKDLKKLLKPTGIICIITPNCKSAWVALEKIMDGFKLGPKMNKEQHLSKFDKNSLVTIFEVIKMKTVLITSFNFISWLCINKRLSTFVCNLELKSKMNYGNLLLGIFGF
jgi:2-polyprenyl-3-methyl-5-hydroxy-6-metoxy-1,4-benzoquinol methylase